MDIKQRFLSLTSRTYPHGTEKDIFHLLGEGLKEDEFGNLFIKIGDSDVMFTSHLDTATSALTEVKHVFDGKIIKTDGKSILGADDKAGVTIMLYMIEKKIPGLYYFFLGEEVGCVGSRKVAASQKENKIEGINKVVSFDRRGTTSVITYQSGQRCASDKFGEALASELNKADETFSYKIDPTGVLTDSVQFIGIYSECTNISVGYYSEHTFSESQDIEHLEKLAKACAKVDWKSLPTERDPSKTEYRTYGSYYGSSSHRNTAWSGGYDDWDDYYGGDGISAGSRWSGWNGKSSFDTKPKTENIWFHDSEFNYVSKVEIESYSKKYVSVDLDAKRISKEKAIIDSLLKSLELEFKSTTWDGLKLVVKYDDNHTSNADRNDLIDYLPELDYKLIEDETGAYDSYFDGIIS
jgi:hypothetical protein